MGFAITNSGVDIHSGGYTSGGSRQTIENDITKLQKQRDEYEQQKDTDDTAAIDEKIASLEKRINNLQQRLDKLKSKEEEKDSGECQTCKNRRYQDGSDDPGVSFKTAGKINPETPRQWFAAMSTSTSTAIRLRRRKMARRSCIRA